MNRRFVWNAALILLIVVGILPMSGAFHGIAQAEPTTYTGDLDIGQMLDEAKQVWDFDHEDAVILLEGVRYIWGDDGRLSEQHHRVVWIRTDRAVEDYADLRVPWDRDRQELKVDALRVWRDNRWIEARPTAVVETTPFAFSNAAAYTGIRETMLLHDGVELPCILECSYTIADRQTYRNGFEGQWIFPQGDPALNSWLIIQAPEGYPLTVKGFNGAVEAGRELPGGMAAGQVYSFRMQDVPASPLPATNDPAVYLPHVQWSSFSSWNMLGNVIRGQFLTNAMMNEALRDSVTSLLKDADTPSQKADLVAEFVSSHMRDIQYDPKWFLYRPRLSGKTWESSYGTSFDLAILTGTLMKEAGFEVWPVLLGQGYGDINEGVPTLARLQEPGLWVSGPGVEAYYDPTTGTLHNGLSPIYNRSIWLPGYDETPMLRWSGEGSDSMLLASFDLTWDGEKWSGTGYYEAGGGFSPYDRMEGGGNHSGSYLNRVCDSILGEAEVSGFSPVSFDRFTVSCDLTVEVKAADRDDQGRLPLIMGAPEGGFLKTLPGFAPLYLAERGTPVPLPGSGEETVKLKLHSGELERVRLPETVEIENNAGQFTLSVERGGDTILLKRYLKLNRSSYKAAEWPELRALLLAESNAASQTVLFK